MRRFILLLFSLWLAPAAAQDRPPGPPPEPPEPIRPPYYSCMVQREVPNGTVQAFKLIERSGRPYGGGDRLHTWVSDLSPGGVQLHATWSEEPPAETGSIDILYPMADTQDVYRIQVRRDSPVYDLDDLQLESGLRHARDGSLHVSASWGPFLGLLAGAPDPRIVVLGADGNVLRSDPVDLAGFARAVALGDSLEPELDAMVADYRNRCTLIQSLPGSPPGEPED
jgi:hypothetical protein